MHHLTILQVVIKSNKSHLPPQRVLCLCAPGQADTSARKELTRHPHADAVSVHHRRSGDDI
jgi:hypothetical protein